MGLYRVITFDFTNTLLKLKRPIGEVYANAARQFKIETDAYRLTEMFKIQWRHFNKTNPNFGLGKEMHWRSWWKDLVSQTFISSGYSIDNAKLDLICKSLLDSYATKANWSLVPEAPELLSTLKEKNSVTLGIISNFDPRLNSLIRQFNLLQYFTFIITSYEVNLLKPQPEIFNLALELSNQTDAKYCLHVGDDLHNDYWGAKNASWSALLINSDKKDLTDSQVNPQEIVKDLSELKKILVS